MCSVESKSGLMYICMYVCKMSCYWAPRVNYRNARKRIPGTMCNTCYIKHFTCFVVVLIWRNTDEMPLNCSETADGRVIGRGEWSPASRRRTYVAPNVWQVNPSGVLKKLWNASSKQTFDSIHRYRHSHHLSTERQDIAAELTL